MPTRPRRKNAHRRAYICTRIWQRMAAWRLPGTQKGLQGTQGAQGIQAQHSAGSGRSLRSMSYLIALIAGWIARWSTCAGESGRQPLTGGATRGRCFGELVRLTSRYCVKSRHGRWSQWSGANLSVADQRPATALALASAKSASFCPCGTPPFITTLTTPQRGVSRGCRSQG